MNYGEIGVARGIRLERRARLDRRKPYLLSDWRYAFRGRRRGTRRPGEAATAGTDLYHPRIMILAVLITLLNALDAAFTLQLVLAGAAEEWNPLMRALLHDDVQLFVNLKIAITTSALTFLIVCSNMVILGRLRVERLLWWLLAAYTCVVCYHLVLLGLAV